MVSVSVNIATGPENVLPSVAEMFVAVAAIAWSEIERSVQKLQPLKLLAVVVVRSQNPPASAHRNEYGFEPETITWSTGSPSE